MSDKEADLTVYRKKVFFVRGQAVMLDKDLAVFYEIPTKVFNQAMKRKKEFFQNEVFQLTKEEYEEILALQNLPMSKGHLPWAFTQKAAYKMAFVLDSKVSMKVADLIVDVFLEVQRGTYVPKVQDNKTLVIEQRLEKIETEMQGRVSIVNNFHAPVTVVQGGTAQVNLGVKEEFILKIMQIMHHQEVLTNTQLTSLLSKAIDQANKKR